MLSPGWVLKLIQLRARVCAEREDAGSDWLTIWRIVSPRTLNPRGGVAREAAGNHVEQCGGGPRVLAASIFDGAGSLMCAAGSSSFRYPRLCILCSN